MNAHARDHPGRRRAPVTTCRLCGGKSRIIRAQRRIDGMWVLLACGTWRPWPNADEVVMWNSVTGEEVWGRLRVKDDRKGGAVEADAY